MKRFKPFRRTMRALLQAQRHRCALCAGPLFPKSQFPADRGLRSPLYPTIDHVWPVSRGHGDRGNLVVAHLRCNMRKADRLPTGCEVVMLAAVNARMGIAA